MAARQLAQWKMDGSASTVPLPLQMSALQSAVMERTVVKLSVTMEIQQAAMAAALSAKSSQVGDALAALLHLLTPAPTNAETDLL